ncbi:MAG: anthranilate synthase, component [Acidobacteriaceae bacterium]|nr:anthranilate synthase, component [Acidobacteriaceae bacterium]
MLIPDLKEFTKLAGNSTLVPVSKTISADLLTPVSAFLSISRKEQHAFLLESVVGGEKVGRYTFLGIRPYMIVSSRGPQITITNGKKVEHRTGDIFTVVRELLGQHRPATVPGLPPFTSGAVGFFSYDAVRQLEKIPEISTDDMHLPDCVLMFFNRVLAFDHLRHEIHLIAAADVSKEPPKRAYQRALKDIRRMERLLKAGVPRSALRRPAAETSHFLKLRRTTEHQRYLKDVERIRDYISAGDVFQTVLSQRMQMEPGVPPLDIYRALRTVNPSPYMYFLKMDDLHVLGSSPEMLVKVTSSPNGNGQSTLKYRPIAGTRPRSADEAEDQRLENELRSDEKECAEHVMLVDLGRNDLGRVSEYGTVQVKELMKVERYSHVMHLVSSLESKLRKGLDAIDAFASCFPAGTLTGAPKVRAMEIIEELEPVRRGIYGGSVLYADFAGNLDSCIAIRTMVMKGKNAYVQSGAGIVADSVAQLEHEECLNKGQALIRAVEKARQA